jgi:sensor histidine kinase YesM
MNLFNSFNKRILNTHFVIQLVFHLLFFSTFITVVFSAYNYSIEHYLSARIFSSDVFEGSVIILLTYIFYYVVFKSQKLIIHKLLWLVSGIFILAIIAYNKEGSFSLDILEPLVSYIGLGSILFLALWIINHTKLIFNNRVIVTRASLKVAERQLLRQQFNPHFLFNAFNSLYSLSLKNHPKTPDTILKLSGMMRYLTDDTNIPLVKLTSELNFIEEYISIEKIRFGEKADIQFTINGEIEGKEIEPLLFITLVENAFKHGFYTNDPTSFVHIILKITVDSIEFSVKNSVQVKQHFQKEKRTGKGLEILKKRLNISYPKQSKLTLTEKDAVYLAELIIRTK